MIPWEESSAKTYASAGPFWLSKEVIDAIENMSEVLKTEDIESVSYTHLDVYKRQIIFWINLENEKEHNFSDQVMFLLNNYC